MCYRHSMKKRTPFYPCLGYCIIDARGYCVACGRPPTLGAPENSALGKAAVSSAKQEQSPSPQGSPDKN